MDDIYNEEDKMVEITSYYCLLFVRILNFVVCTGPKMTFPIYRIRT